MTEPGCYEVHACRYAYYERKAWQVQITPDLHDADHPMDYFIWVCFPVDGGGRRVKDAPPIVVDTGFNPETAVERGREMLRDPGRTLVDFGVELERVRDVVITHMHYDHAGGWRRFPNARFHVQDSEMAYATGRDMCHAPLRRGYDVVDVMALVRANYEGRVVFHDGDGAVAPGLSVHLIGGHTAGMQSVRVRTRNGWLVLASDASHYYWGIHERRLSSSIHSAVDMLAGYQKLVQLAEGREAMVVPGHDTQVMQRYPASSEALRGWAVRLD